MASGRREDQWIVIQQKTFVNWANEQLSLGNRSVSDLATDFSDGVRLVALVEALQFRKIGKVYPRPTGRIQMLHNVTLALQAVQADGVRLVNIGTDDIVCGNLKLTLGLLWHLILRYQIAASPSRAPPKKLMLSWFQAALPQLSISNFTSHWSDGIALHALLEYCKPGLAPHWRELNHKDRVLNCKHAMTLAKDQLSVPRVISAEDFASSELDELSAMTYLSYFIRKDSPGYYSTLNWVCKQLKTTNISNLTTDWNDGYLLCCLVHSLGGEVSGWPTLDRSDHVTTCQKGIDSAKKLGVEPLLTGTELSDPAVDHLSVMAYLARFQRVQPRKVKAEKLEFACQLDEVKVGKPTSFRVLAADVDVEESKVKIGVVGPAGVIVPVQVDWCNKVAFCSFTPKEKGLFKISAHYDGELICGCPLEFNVRFDPARVKVTAEPDMCSVGKSFTIQVSCPPEMIEDLSASVQAPAGGNSILQRQELGADVMYSCQPDLVGIWTYMVTLQNTEITSGQFVTFDPMKAILSGTDGGAVGDSIVLEVDLQNAGASDLEVDIEYSAGRRLEDVNISTSGDVRQVTFNPKKADTYRVKARLNGEVVKGSPKTVEVVDPGDILVTGDGLTRGAKGMEAFFDVNTQNLAGEVTAVVDVDGYLVPVMRETRGVNLYQFSYVPCRVGAYSINVYWKQRLVPGSPFVAKVSDKSHVTLKDDLTERKDENDHLVLEYDTPTVLNFDLSGAGPGKFTAEVLSPEGKLPVSVSQTDTTGQVSFTATAAGDHYVHLYWADAPVEFSPIPAHCHGKPRPLDPRNVLVLGEGAETARATVPAHFVIDGRKAGPGVLKVRLQGVHACLPVEVVPLKYDRYRCTYTPSLPGGFLLYVYWSDELLPGCPFKVSVTARGDVNKVKVTGEGLHGGIAGHELKVFVSTLEAGPGEVTAWCQSPCQTARCDVKEVSEGQFTVRVTPIEPEKHVLTIKYDGCHVLGSPFTLRVGEPPDPSRVRVLGPGVEDGLLGHFTSSFLVDTLGAGAGQLAVKVRGPKGGFKVDMRRETQAERTIRCRYDPSEPGEYLIQVRWSGVHVPGSPFLVHLVETKEELDSLSLQKGFVPTDPRHEWRAEI